VNRTQLAILVASLIVVSGVISSVGLQSDLSSQNEETKVQEQKVEGSSYIEVSDQLLIPEEVNDKTNPRVKGARSSYAYARSSGKIVFGAETVQGNSFKLVMYIKKESSGGTPLTVTTNTGDGISTEVMGKNIQMVQTSRKVTQSYIPEGKERIKVIVRFDVSPTASQYQETEVRINSRAQ
jgi:hypothetical protein